MDGPGAKGRPVGAASSVSGASAMSPLNRHVRSAQRRLWLNRWFGLWGWMLTFSAAAWIIGLLGNRILGLYPWPVGLTAAVALAAGFVGSLVWLLATREPTLAAAAELDHAAGLQERLSSSLSLRPDSDDPFESAVVADAERAVAGLTARRFLPLRWAGSLSLGAVLTLAAALLLLLPEFDLLHREEDAAKTQARAASLRQARVALAKPVSALQEIAKKNPEFGMEDEIKHLDDPLTGRDNTDPDFTRREALKQLSRMRDALEKKANADRFRSLKETKKRLRQIGIPQDPKSDVAELIANLSAGDFEGARKAVKKIQERLAKRARQGKLDPQALQKMQKQLQSLAKKMEQAARDRKSERELQNAGLSKAEARKVLETLAKKDPKQLEQLAKNLAKRLKSKGITEQQMKQMLRKMQQRQKAGKQCQGLGKKMGQCAKAMEQGDIQSAQQELNEAGDMLSEMEQLEQALNELDAQKAQLEEAGADLEDFDPEKDDLMCKLCQGTGFRADGAPCPRCNGTGQCQGRNRGRGAAPRARDDNAKTSTINKKARTRQGRGGSIIGRQFVKGKQLKGKTRIEFSEALSAGELDRTDAMNRARIPRRYQGPVKRFFDRLGDDFKNAKKTGDDAPTDK